MIPHCRLIRHRRRDDRGFTLIELLVVIVILGILSAVVVFAVRGSGDKGDAAARTTDKRIIRTAMETFCARYGRYPQGDTSEARMDELVKGPRIGQTTDREGPGFLSGSSTYNTVPPAPATGCGGLGTLPGEECKSPTPGEPPEPWLPGMWCKVAAPSSQINSRDFGMVQLNDGRIFTGLEIFDPKTGAWQKASRFDSQVQPTGMVVLKDNPETLDSECGTRCGRVLAKLNTTNSQKFEPTWALFDPAFASPSSDRVGSWERIGSPPPLNNDEGKAAQIMGNKDDCINPNRYCGKVLVTGGNGSLYDPRMNQFLPFPISSVALAGSRLLMAPLPRGQVFVMFLSLAAAAACASPPGNTPRTVSCYETRVFDPLSGTFVVGPTPPIGVDLPQTGGSLPVVLPNGRVVFHYTDNLSKFATGVYEPGKGPIAAPGGTGSWIDKKPCPARTCNLVSHLPGGNLIATGSGGLVSLPSWEFDIDLDLWVPAENLQQTGASTTFPPPPGILITAIPGVPDTCGTNCNKVLAAGPLNSISWAQLYKPR